ncbi:MAG: hypothetical protein [Sanya fiers-like virus 35]|nr:MAG: hypothetical protein [Sanya fiers-like virus 35]
MATTDNIIPWEIVRYKWLTWNDVLVALACDSIGDQVMDKNLQQQILIAEYFGYADVLSSRGITLAVLGEDELKKLSIPDLRACTQILRDLARTPSRG